MRNPTPTDIRKALKEWLPKSKLKFAPGWDKRGRPWTYGIRGEVVHHWAGTGPGAREWMISGEGGAYPYCNAVVERDGTVTVASALSVWHSGRGGPWKAAGVPQDLGHLMLWGIEMEGPLKGTPYGTDDMTDNQWRNTIKMLCAIRAVAGKQAFPSWRRVIRHGDWTDGTAGVSATPLPTVGRKNDVWADTTDIRARAQDMWVKGKRKGKTEGYADG